MLRMNEPWEVLFTPVKKGQEFEVDINSILDQWVDRGMIDGQGRVNWTQGQVVKHVL